ncbi:MAG: histidine kinase [Actinomycetota bacterium]
MRIGRRTAAQVAWALFVISVGASAATLFVEFKGNGIANFGTVSVALLPAYSVLGAVVASRQPRNAVGWIFCAVGLTLSVASVSQGYADYALSDAGGTMPGGDVAAWLGTWIWPPAILLMFTFLPLLFPDGRLPSRRWRPAAWLAALLLVVEVVPVAVTGWPLRGPILNEIGDEAPVRASDAFKFAFNLQVAAIILMFVLGLACAASLVLRYRRADAEERAQLKWITLAAGFLVIAIIVNSPLIGFGGAILPTIALALVPAACGVAILKYHLYEIDVVIHQTVVFGALAAFITAVYVGIVVGIGSLVGRGDEPNVALSIAATALVAVAFQPVRSRVQRFANRVVYGKRAEPYELLSRFSERVGETEATEQVLPRTAQVLAEGTGARQAEVWLRAGSRLVRGAAWPEGNGAAEMKMPDGALPPFPGVTSVLPVKHQGELLGALTLTKAPGDPLKPSEEKLLEDLSLQAGLVLRNVGLTADLEARLDEISTQAEELRASRQRIIEAQDTERRKLERNIHDGAQQHLVALAVKLRLAKSLAKKDPVKARAMLEELQSQTKEALDTLRDLARGIYPPLLEAKGVAAALEAQVAKGTLHAKIEAADSGRAPLETEATVYFCCLEALQNIGKYANASQVTIRLGREDGALIFSVEDDGAGFDPATQPTGSGLQNMRDRVEALGGSVGVTSAPGKGTKVSGLVPVGKMEPAG